MALSKEHVGQLQDACVNIFESPLRDTLAAWSYAPDSDKTIELPACKQRLELPSVIFVAPLAEFTKAISQGPSYLQGDITAGALAPITGLEENAHGLVQILLRLLGMERPSPP